LPDALLTQFFDVERRLWSVAFTVCAGVLASEPRTVTVVPAVADVGAVIDSFVLWHRAGVAFVRGAVTPANSITAPATTTAARVEMVIVLFILPLRETGWGEVDPRLITLSSSIHGMWVSVVSRL